MQERDREIGLGDVLVFAFLAYVVACTLHSTVALAGWLCGHVRIN